jgi:excisionase family DNA binding protein
MRVMVRDEQVRAFFTPAELARYLNVTPRTVASMLAGGVVPSYKVGGNRRIAAEDLDRYLARCRQDAA